MILWLYRFLKGYLIVEFFGEKTEQILNLTAKSRINLWGLRCTKRKIIGCIGIKDFMRLRNIIFGNKIKVHILKKCGLPFIIKRYNSRIGFYIGAVIFFVILKIMSSYIWIINIEGNKTINENNIISWCRQLGIYEGVNSKKIDSKNDAVKLVLENEDIAWASLNIEGSVLNINISETKGNDADMQKNPSNIKASFDGVITRIDVTSGDVLVKTGDVVKKGDLLVSGIIENTSSTVFTSSSGVITAHTHHEFVAQGKKTQKIAQKIGKTKKHSLLKVFNVYIPLYLGEIKEPCVAEFYEQNAVLFGKKIPISIMTKKCNLIKYVNKKYSNEELIQKLNLDIEKQTKNSDFKILEEVENRIEESDEKICIKKIYLCEENIAQEEPIIINSVN